MGKRILVVDDDPVIRMLVSECLASAGHTVEMLSSGKECIAHLDRERPDLLVIDLLMPEVTGFDVIRGIRDSTALANLPIILLSANTERDVQPTEGPRADRYIQKPFHLRELIDAVAEMA